MTKPLPEQLAELEALSAKATQGPWESDSIQSDGCYGDGGPDGRSGFTTYAIFDDKNRALLDALKWREWQRRQVELSDQLGVVADKMKADTARAKDQT